MEYACLDFKRNLPNPQKGSIKKAFLLPRGFGLAGRELERDGQGVGAEGGGRRGGGTASRLGGPCQEGVEGETERGNGEGAERRGGGGNMQGYLDFQKSPPRRTLQVASSCNRRTPVERGMEGGSP